MPVDFWFWVAIILALVVAFLLFLTASMLKTLHLAVNKIEEMTENRDAWKDHAANLLLQNEKMFMFLQMQGVEVEDEDEPEVLN